MSWKKDYKAKGKEVAVTVAHGGFQTQIYAQEPRAVF